MLNAVPVKASQKTVADPVDVDPAIPNLCVCKLPALKPDETTKEMVRYTDNKACCGKISVDVRLAVDDDIPTGGTLCGHVGGCGRPAADAYNCSPDLDCLLSGGSCMFFTTIPCAFHFSHCDDVLISQTWLHCFKSFICLTTNYGIAATLARVESPNRTCILQTKWL